MLGFLLFIQNYGILEQLENFKKERRLLTVQQQMNRLKDQIVQGMPDNLSTIEQVRYLYIELGKMVSFDERYWKGNSKMQKKIYKGSFHKKIEDLRTDRRIICVSLSYMFQELLSEIGVYATVDQEDPDDPHMNNIVLVDGKRYVMDLQRDLEYIQTNRRTRFFGKETRRFASFATISEEEEEKIDHKIGYYREEEGGYDYTKDYLREIKKQLQESTMTLAEKVELLLSRSSQYKNLAQMQLVEKSKWYNLCFRECFTRSEMARISEVFLRRTADDQLVSTISVQDATYEHCTRFIHVEGNEKYCQMGEQELESLLKQGIYVETRDKLWKSKARGEQQKTPNGGICFAPTEPEEK